MDTVQIYERYWLQTQDLLVGRCTTLYEDIMRLSAGADTIQGVEEIQYVN